MRDSVMSEHLNSFVSGRNPNGQCFAIDQMAFLATIPLPTLCDWKASLRCFHRSTKRLIVPRQLRAWSRHNPSLPLQLYHLSPPTTGKAGRLFSGRVPPVRLKVAAVEGSTSESSEGGLMEKSGLHCNEIIRVESEKLPVLNARQFVKQDLSMSCLVLVGAYVWVRLFDYLTKRGVIGQKLSRKLVHITSGFLYMLCWPFYSVLQGARFIAALVPFLNALRLLIYGLGILKDEGLVRAVSREGDSKELLRGPLFYVLVVITSTIVFWRHSPVGPIALSMMCGGDGIADIIGRRFGSARLPYNEQKSWAGSISMFLFGFLLSLGSVYYFSALGFFNLKVMGAWGRIALICLAATVMESLPISTRLDDNLTVPFTSVAFSMLLFPYSSTC